MLAILHDFLSSITFDNYGFSGVFIRKILHKVLFES